MVTFRLAAQSLRTIPNDAPDMEKGEVRIFTFDLSGGIGINTISGEATIAAPGLTVGDVVKSGATITAPITAPNTGTYTVKLAATLSSAEVRIMVVRVKVVDTTLQAVRTTRYE